YYDGKTRSGTIINNNGRDRKIYDGSVRLSYEFVPNYQIFINNNYNIRRYDHIISTNRNSEGFELTVGTSIDISGKSKGEVFVGYLKQEYESSDLENIQSPTFGANILWNVTQLTSLIVGVTRSVEET